MFVPGKQKQVKLRIYTKRQIKSTTIVTDKIRQAAYQSWMALTYIQRKINWVVE